MYEFSNNKTLYFFLKLKSGMVMPTFNPIIQEIKADGSLWVQAQSTLHSELQATQSNTIRLPQKKKKKMKEKKRFCFTLKQQQTTK